MKLKNVLNDIETEFVSGDLDTNISDLQYDSRKIQENNLFIAVSGFEVDGHDFIDDAVNNGASAVVIEKDLDKYAQDISYIKVKNSRKCMALLAANFFNKPLRYIDLIGITGTNGKTTTANLIYNILKNSGIKAALFGTINNIIDGQEVVSKRTTPESLDLYRYFSRLVDKGIKYAVMEVSSHALDLYRVYGMEFILAVFTNLSSEHLDYHKTFDNYRSAKAKLFKKIKKNGFAVINIDDSSADHMLRESNGENYFYSLESSEADLFIKEYNLNQYGAEYTTSGLFEEKININLGGIFNLYNSLAALLSSYLLGIKKNILLESIKKIDGIPGRFELINEEQNFQVIVDYAHTPDGMKNVLESVENINKNKLIVLFGCGGDRDRSKRPAMAALAEKYADKVIVSNDNPRSEKPVEIFSEIEKGFSSDYDKYIIIEDRRQAIRKALETAEEDDIVLILGRGHEKYQIIGDQKVELDDRAVVREFIRESKVKK